MLNLEYNAFEKTGCWRVAKISALPPSVKPITCKWVLKLKFVNGVYRVREAQDPNRCQARGFEQRKGVDYFQSFSPTASQVSLLLVLALTTSPGFLSVDLDATSPSAASDGRECLHQVRVEHQGQGLSYQGSLCRPRRPLQPR